MPSKVYMRYWFRERTEKLNARGLTSRGTPMKQRRRVYGRSKADYQRAFRAELKARGLTTRGTAPVRRIQPGAVELRYQEFRASLNIRVPEFLSDLERSAA